MWRGGGDDGEAGPPLADAGTSKWLTISETSAASDVSPT
jgi:hypothetical protein